MTYRLLIISISCLIFLCSCGSSSKKNQEPITLDVVPDPPKVGQWFQYQHTGPRPWGDSQKDVSGERMIRVIGQQVEEEKTYWAVEDDYAKDNDEQISLYDDTYFLHRQLSRSNVANAVYQYNPPVSDRHLLLKPDQDKVEESEIIIQNPETGGDYGKIYLTRNVKRVRDERIVTKIKYDYHGAVTEFGAQEETYWCDQIAWFVLERVEFQPAIQQGNFVGTGHTSESILVDFEQNP
jgi:hypothetical protein